MTITGVIAGQITPAIAPVIVIAGQITPANMPAITPEITLNTVLL